MTRESQKRRRKGGPGHNSSVKRNKTKTTHGKSSQQSLPLKGKGPKADADPRISQSGRGFPFLKLPAELRNKIYLLALKLPSYLRINVHNVSYGSLDHALFCVNRQVRAEAKDVFFSENSFEIWDDANRLVSFLTNIGKPNQQALRHLVIQDFNRDLGKSTRSVTAWQDHLSECTSLQTVTIYPEKQGLPPAWTRTLINIHWKGIQKTYIPCFLQLPRLRKLYVAYRSVSSSAIVQQYNRNDGCEWKLKKGVRMYFVRPPGGHPWCGVGWYNIDVRYKDGEKILLQTEITPAWNYRSVKRLPDSYTIVIHRS